MPNTIDHTQPIPDGNPVDLAALRAESQAEGFRLIAKAVNAYPQGLNRFGQTGAFDVHNRLLAIGGLSPDPDTQHPHIGRLRHRYVLAAYRQQGIASSLLTALTQAACPYFDTLVLSPQNIEASARLYARHGFPMVTASTHHHQKSLRAIQHTADAHPLHTRSTSWR